MRPILLLIGLILSGQSFAQNLVPNPSFEEVNFDFCGLFPSPEKFEASNKYWLAPTSCRPDIYSQIVDTSCWNYISGVGNPFPRTGK